MQFVEVVNFPTANDSKFLFAGTLAFLTLHGLFFGWLFASKEAEDEL